jgi:hypothetical protein
MTHPLYTPTARSPKVISFEPLQRGADAAEAAIRAAEDQLVSAMKAEEARAALYAKRDQLIEEPSDLPSRWRSPGRRTASWWCHTGRSHGCATRHAGAASAASLL